MTLQNVCSTGVDESTPGDIFNDVIVKHAPSQVLIGIVTNSPPCGLSRSLKVAKRQQSMPPGLGGNKRKLDAVVDGNLPDDIYSASIFRKVIGHKLSDSSSGGLYWRCRMNFTNYHIQNQA